MVHIGTNARVVTTTNRQEMRSSQEGRGTSRVTNRHLLEEDGMRGIGTMRMK